MLEAVAEYVRGKWWQFSGEAAETVVEHYDNAADAIVFPLFGVGMTAVFVFAAVELWGPFLEPGWFMSCVLFAIALAHVSITANYALASGWYATEVTELEAEYWGGGAGAD